MSIQDEQARVITEASSRMERSDADALRQIARMTRDSSCVLCARVHEVAAKVLGAK